MMWNTFEQDKPYLESKYLNPTFDPNTGLSAEELLAGLEKIYADTRALPHPTVKAMAVAYVLDHVRINVSPHDWFVGIDGWRFLRDRMVHKTIIMKWQEEVYQKYASEERRRMKIHNACGSLSIWPDYDHSVPDWKAVLKLGFPGLRQRAKDCRERHREAGTLTAEREIYYDAIETEYAAILRFLARLQAQAEEKGRQYPRCAMTAKCLKTLMEGAPTNSYEMLQLDYLFFFIAEYFDGLQVRSFGNLDQMLYPFYQKDLQEGVFTDSQIRELVSYFLQQAHVMHHYWGHPLYLGGSDETGKTLINPVSYLILEEFDRMGLYDPKIQIKWDKALPEAFVNQVLDMIRRGHNSIAIVCMPNVIKAMMSFGVTEREAQECVVSGCYEVQVAGNSTQTAAGHINMAKGVEMVLNNGRDALTGQMIGVETGGLEEFTSFDAFYEAYLKQIRFLTREALTISGSVEGHFLELNPAPMFSSTVYNSVQQGRDAYAGGCKYMFTSILVCNVASAVNALMAVKELVYDTGEYTLTQLNEILEKDWEGHDRLRLRMKRSHEKFGNHQALSDRYGAAIASFVANQINMKPSQNNGYYITSLHCARQFIEMGKRSAASPEGRKRGEEYSKNISAAMGTNWAGTTALIESVTELNTTQFLGDFPLDVMLHPSAAQGEEGLAAMKQLIQTYSDRGGLAIHFNVMDVEVLRDAQKHPEKYEDLQVRVCGWNVLWNNLPLSEQEQYIAQAQLL